MTQPDAPGPYHFRGHIDYGHGPASQPIDQPVRVYHGRITGEWQVQGQRIGVRPARHLRGVWMKLA